jgi:hypothetical protein
MERLRHESQILAALKDLPKDLAETYIRIFESIPETDQDFVRRVFIWICGHAGGLWMKDTGIDADLLVSAVSYDLAGTSPGSRYDCDDLRELCGCLITFSPEARDISREHGENLQTPDKMDHKKGDFREQTVGHPNLVSLAHYTVMEFLVSPIILKTPVSQFALDEVTIFNEFALSCLKQALSADPEGTSTDWDRDREAYCLTLVCALGLRFQYFANKPDIQGLLIQYYDPSASHFARLPAIQDRIVHSQGVSQNYMLRRLPVLAGAVHSVTQTQLRALAMLNLLCASGAPELLLRYMEGRSAQELLDVRLTVQAYQSMLEGTIPEILLQHTRYARGLRWLMKYYGTYIDATRILMGLIGDHFGSGCKHQSTANPACFLSRLLALKADLNAPHFKITPLQLAAYRFDYNALKMLLESGADPNALGHIDGEEVQDLQPLPNRKQRTLVEIASSCTPLQILRICRFSNSAKGKRIEQLLIANGAREKEEEEVSSSKFCQPESHATIPSFEGTLPRDAGETDNYPMGDDKNDVDVDV